MRTVTLELLRHGPAHNQLLSPQTPYLALCGNHDAETVHVGSEHLQFMRRIQQLRYLEGMRAASFARLEAAHEVTRLLESIRSLTAELASSDPTEANRMIHLRLVLSSSELALLPFEFANAYTGGQPLSLQTVTPLCLTREVRRVAARTFQWPDWSRLRILVIAAAPPRVSAVPLREHLQALRDALAPYLVTPKEFDQSVTVLPMATLEDVREACTGTAFTHVHVLAHGIEGVGDGGEPQFGLAFHQKDDPDEVDVVLGRRLAMALRCHRQGATGQALSSPVVVSIASCDSANVGSVVAPGGSIAHALHDEGIPLVVASQFPLSVQGSVVMTSVLYRRLLRGDDPRLIVHDLRQALYTNGRGGDSHDWASVVVYAALPDDLEVQLKHARFEQAHRAVDVVMARADELLARREQERPPDTRNADEEEVRKLLLEAMTRFELVAPLEGGVAEKVNAWGTLASAWKQIARFFWVPDARAVGPEGPSRERFLEALEAARSYYYKCFQSGLSEAWPLVQYLALTLGLGVKGEKLKDKELETFKRRWTLASALAEENLVWGTVQQKAWAHGSLAELALLSTPWRQPGECEAEALRHIEELFAISSMGSYPGSKFDTYGVLRQLSRYSRWKWGDEPMVELSLRLCEELKRRGAKAHWTRT
jgi:hypothetical protein